MYSYQKYIAKSEYVLANIYMFFSTISHFVFLYSPVLLISLLVFWVFRKQILTKYLFIILSVFFISILKLDSIVYDQFRYHLSPFVFELVFGKNASDIFDVSSFSIPFVIFTIIVLILLEFLFFYLSKKITLKNINFHIKPTSIGLIIAFSFTQLVYAWADASYYRPITQIANVYPLYYPLTAKGFLTRNNFVDAEEVRKNRDLYRITNNHLIKYPLSKIVSTPLGQKKNIIFLIIDSWRYDCMDSLITPNIYKLSTQSQYFENHYSGSNGTRAGIFSLFYGISGLYWQDFTNFEKSPVFIDELMRQEYQIKIWASATIQNPTFDKNIFSKVKNLRLKSKGKSICARDKEITDECLSFLENENSSKPFFAFLFYDSAHGFCCPSTFNNKFTPSLTKINLLELNDNYEPTKLFNRYKNSLYYIDDQIGKILQKLEEKGILESSILVISGDHGQEFNDNKKGYWQHGGNYSKYQIKVPLLLYDKNKEAKTYHQLSVHYDIIPSLMSTYLGVKTPIEDYSSGQNLFHLKKREWFSCGANDDYAIIEKDRITKVYLTGVFDITDLALNPLMDADLHYNKIKEAMKEIKKFYEKY